METNCVPWGKIDTCDPDLTILLPGEKKLGIGYQKDLVSLSLEAKDQEAEESLFLTGSGGNLYLEPALPDLPLLLKPAHRLSILPEQTMKAYVEVPVFIRIFFQTETRKDLLTEIPALVLSKSYFGPPDNGKIAYSLESPLHNSVKAYSGLCPAAYCPLVIMNKSAQPLLFERMMLQVPYITLYRGKQRLYGTTVVIRFRGADQISQVSIQKDLPEVGEELKLAAPPRMKEDKNLIRRSFYYIKTFYNA